MPFGCVPIRQSAEKMKSAFRKMGSPMPFGCVPIRQRMPRADGQVQLRHVSNAFRLCAYPADSRLPIWSIAGWAVSNAFRLCAYPADLFPVPALSAESIVSNAFRLCAYPAASPGTASHADQIPKSPMPFGCVPIRQL